MVACAFTDSLLFDSYTDNIRVRGYVCQRAKHLRTLAAYVASAVGVCSFRSVDYTFCGIVYGGRACRGKFAEEKEKTDSVSPDNGIRGQASTE